MAKQALALVEILIAGAFFRAWDATRSLSHRKGDQTMPKIKKEESERAREKARIRELQKGPDLEKYLVGRKKLYVSYAEEARLYSMNYYTFVKLAKAAGANIRIKKNVVIDLTKVEAFMENAEEGDGGIEDV